MYQAIVLLPLIGCIIAGAIALVGARNRLPGANPTADTGHDPHGQGTHAAAARSA